MTKWGLYLALSSALTAFSLGEAIEEAKAKSLVPVNAQIDALETRLSIAKILSRHKQTQETATHLFAFLVEESSVNPAPAIKKAIALLDAPEPTAHMVESLVSKESRVSDFETRLALARIFSHHKKSWAEALALYRVLLAEKPAEVNIYIEMGRLLMNLKQEDEALSLFYSALKRHPDNPKLLVATAQGEVTVGYAQRARCHFLRALSAINTASDTSTMQQEQKEPGGLPVKGDYYKTLVEYADGMMMWGDFYHAESIYRDAIDRDPFILENYLKLAWSLTSAQRYEEAEEIYRGLLLTHPNEPKILLPLARLKFQEKKFDAAMEAVDALLETDPVKPEYLKQKADILWMQYQYCEAMAYYERFQEHSEYGVDAYIGIGRALIKLGRDGEAYAVLTEGLSYYPKSVALKYYVSAPDVEDVTFINSIIDSATTAQELEKWGEVYIQNGLPENALLFYQAAAEIDPEFFPGKLGFAETLSITYQYEESIQQYQELLDIFPENSKLMLAIARVTAWSKQYDLAIALYDEIIKINPNDPVLYREKARTALWGKKFELGMATYDELLSRPVDSLSQYLIQESISLEKRAKALVWDKQFIHSLDAYEELLDFSPGNEEGLFDYAQSYCSLSLYDRSQNVYDTILHLDPSHNLVKQAAARNQLKWHPLLQNNLTYWRELGSGTFSQSQIARYRFDTAFELPLSSRTRIRLIQQEYVENPFYNFRFYPAEGQTLEADSVLNEKVSCFVSATYKNYFNRFRSTFSSHNWLAVNVNDYFQILLSCNKVDEIYNYFSLKQAIQSINTWVKITSNLTHHWSVSGAYEHYFYNDRNNQDHVNLSAEYQFTDTPNIFKIILQGDYRNTAHDTINIVVGSTLVDVIHPYWTPIDYYAASLTLEYRKDYREFVYCEAPQRYFDVKITGSTDSVDNPGLQCILEWKHDFERHWGFELKGLLHRSKQWNAEGAWGNLYYRF